MYACVYVRVCVCVCAFFPYLLFPLCIRIVEKKKPKKKSKNNEFCGSRMYCDDTR